MSSMIERIRDRRRASRNDRDVNRAIENAMTRSARAEIEFFAQRQVR